jgi:hypothetical protein
MVGANTTPFAPVPGMTGAVGNVSENSNNAGGYFGTSPQNPQGGQSPYGSTDGMDGLGAATVGGVNAPPSSTRSGTSAGPSASGSCMDSYQANNAGLGTPPLEPAILGSPSEGPTGPEAKRAWNNAKGPDTGERAKREWNRHKPPVEWTPPDIPRTRHYPEGVPLNCDSQQVSPQSGHK